MASNSPIYNSARWQVSECFNDVGKLSVEKFASAREERDIVLGFDCDGTIAVAFNFFCGDESYVALTLIGDLAKRNFAEKHHII
ncbi:MAG: hypothetical protein DMG46_09835 [Acidobacteria bacterium]|nr:MAG: hypothetical protein DMG46_09835 [Acidobacteriota bacterium]